MNRTGSSASAPEIVLHVGFHKTASTYLQSVLEASIDRLHAAEIGYVTLAEMRRDITPRVRRPGVFGTRLRAGVRAVLARNKSCTRLVLSDENLSGGSRELIDGSFYAPIFDRTVRLADALGSADVQVMIATRSYDSYVSSLYCEHLRQSGFISPTDYVEAAHVERLNWSAIIGGLCRHFGEDRITMWRFEDFPEIEEDVLRAMTGGVAIDWIKPERRLRSAFSQRLVDKLTALSPRMNPVQLNDLIESISETLKNQPSEPFRAYDEETGSALRLRYDGEIASLEREFPRMTMIRPASRADASARNGDRATVTSQGRRKPS